MNTREVIILKNVRMYMKRLIFFSFFGFLCFPAIMAFSVEFYEKPEVIKDMEKRQVISVVKIEDLNSQRNLDMTAAGIVEGVEIPKAMQLMSDYENLQRIAPQYIKKAELSVHKKGGKYEKYLFMQTEVSALLLTYKLEIYSRVWEEEKESQGIVHWEVIPAKSIGRKTEDKERFVGLKGTVSVEKYNVQKHVQRVIQSQGDGRRFYRRRSDSNRILVLFKGNLEKSEKGMSELIPNFALRLAMEVALQRVGVLLRNYLETAKDIPPPRNLEELVQETETREEPTSHPSPASKNP